MPIHTDSEGLDTAAVQFPAGDRGVAREIIVAVGWVARHVSS